MVLARPQAESTARQLLRLGAMLRPLPSRRVCFPLPAQPSLEGSSKLLLIATLNPQPCCYQASQSTLQFAKGAMQLTTIDEPVSCKVQAGAGSASSRTMASEIAQLRAALLAREEQMQRKEEQVQKLQRTNSQVGGWAHHGRVVCQWWRSGPPRWGRHRVMGHWGQQVAARPSSRRFLQLQQALQGQEVQAAGRRAPSLEHEGHVEEQRQQGPELQLEPAATPPARSSPRAPGRWGVISLLDEARTPTAAGGGLGPSWPLPCEPGEAQGGQQQQPPAQQAWQLVRSPSPGLAGPGLRHSPGPAFATPGSPQSSPCPRPSPSGSGSGSDWESGSDGDDQGRGGPTSLAARLQAHLLQAASSSQPRAAQRQPAAGGRTFSTAPPRADPPAASPAAARLLQAAQGEPSDTVTAEAASPGAAAAAAPAASGPSLLSPTSAALKRLGIAPPKEAIAQAFVRVQQHLQKRARRAGARGRTRRLQSRSPWLASPARGGGREGGEGSSSSEESEVQLLGRCTGWRRAGRRWRQWQGPAAG
jgi:hypothetical protein